MRRYSLTLLVVLLVISLGLGAVACGSGGKTATGLTPQEAVKAAMDGVQTATSQSGTYEIALTMDADSSESDPMLGALLAQPIKVTGAFATQMDPVRADLTLGLDLMGMGVELGVRAIDDQAWLNMLGQWYVIPADQLQQQGLGNTADLSASLLQMMDEQGIDPNTWYKDLKVVGKETLVDTKVTHMSGVLDIQKLFTDMFTLMQNPEFMALLGDVAESDGAVSLPDTSELQDLQATIDQMFTNGTFDLWLADADNSLRKLVFATDMTIPQEMGTLGVSGGNVVVTVDFDAPGEAVEVSAPASAKPLDDLAQDMESNPLLSGLGGLLGSGLGGGLLGE